MSTQVSFVLVVLMLCLTFLICFVIEKLNERKNSYDKGEIKYWKGRHAALACVVDKLINCETRDSELEELEDCIVKIRNKHKE